MDLVKVLLTHSKLMYASLPNAGGKLPHSDKCGLLFQQLPVTFDRSTADEVGEHISVSKRSIINYLQRLIDGGQLHKLEHGKYQKR